MSRSGIVVRRGGSVNTTKTDWGGPLALDAVGVALPTRHRARVDHGGGAVRGHDFRRRLPPLPVR